jgi:hypothetical protein
MERIEGRNPGRFKDRIHGNGARPTAACPNFVRNGPFRRPFRTSTQGCKPYFMLRKQIVPAARGVSESAVSYLDASPPPSVARLFKKNVSATASDGNMVIRSYAIIHATGTTLDTDARLDRLRSTPGFDRLAALRLESLGASILHCTTHSRRPVRASTGSRVSRPTREAR